ncbi:MAG: T9SS type A sorting domain-containing protein, partial [Bacteroidota bacterium]
CSYASVLQENMKIVLGGITYNGNVNNIMITRYNAYGSIDVGFGDNGIKVLQFGGSDDWLTDIAVQSDGKIVAVGHTTTGGKTQMIALRLNTDGSLDNSFNTNGMTLIDFGPSINSYGMSMGILDDGKIIVSGYVRDSLLSYSHTAMCRLTSTGVPDNTFGDYGLITYDYLDLFCFPDEMVIHNDRIVLGGVFTNIDFERFAIFSGHYLDGNIDYDFGNFGYTSVALQGDATMMGHAAGNGMCVAPDGKILYTCNQHPGWLENDFAVLRLDQDGGMDYTFGTNGIVVNAMEEDSYAMDVITQADGKIIACGSYKSPDPGSYDFLIMRYLDNGDLDPDFGEAGTGVVISNVSPEAWLPDRSFNLMFCNMDRLLVSGYAKHDFGNSDFAMACYHTGLNVGIEKPDYSGLTLSIQPNPVREYAKICFQLDHSVRVVTKIFNASGTLVSKISDSFYPEGEHQLQWNSKHLPTGLYVIKMSTDDKIYTTKLIKLH